MIESNRSAPSIAHADQRKPARGRRCARAIRWLALLVCGGAVTLLAVCVGSPFSNFGASPLWTYANPADEAEHHATGKGRRAASLLWTAATERCSGRLRLASWRMP